MTVENPDLPRKSNPWPDFVEAREALVRQCVREGRSFDQIKELIQTDDDQLALMMLVVSAARP